MSTEHPITPPPELVQQWMRVNNMDIAPLHLAQALATQAARWGADQELEACVEWIKDQHESWVLSDLRAARRPKPPSLKQQALETLRQIPIDPEAGVSSVELDTIRRALEALPDD